MKPKNPMSRWRRRLIVLVCLLVTIGLLMHLQPVIDWWRLRGYTPPANVAALASDMTMTGAGRHLFYLNRPGVDSKTDFRGKCPDYGEKTIVLGCYLSVERGIYVLAVTDGRLAGVEQVTAAHEMLHAAYDRMSYIDKKKLDQELQDYADHGLTDERIKATLQSYQKTEPGQELNEMHSIFGTEIASLPLALEQHYAQYFSDRKKVAAYAARYQAAFTSRRDLVAKYDAQLTIENKQIQADLAALDMQGKSLDAARQTLDSLRAQGSYAQYNARVDGYNGQVDTYNNLLTTAKSLINQYNQQVDARNAIAAETEQLQQAIDSSVLPARQ